MIPLQYWVIAWREWRLLHAQLRHHGSPAHPGHAVEDVTGLVQHQHSPKIPGACLGRGWLTLRRVPGLQPKTVPGMQLPFLLPSSKPQTGKMKVRHGQTLLIPFFPFASWHSSQGGSRNHIMHQGTPLPQPREDTPRDSLRHLLWSSARQLAQMPARIDGQWCLSAVINQPQGFAGGRGRLGVGSWKLSFQLKGHLQRCRTQVRRWGP